MSVFDKSNLTPLTSFKEGDRSKVIIETSQFGHWRKTFIGGFSTMFKLNLFALLALIPILIFAFKYLTATMSTASVLPFSSTLGTGILSIVDVGEISHIMSQVNFQNYFMILIPVGIFISSMLSSAFAYGIRNAAYNGGFVPFKECFKGYKFCITQFAILGFFLTLCFLLMAFGYYHLSEMIFLGGFNVTTIILIVAFILIALTLASFFMYAYSLSTTYKLSLGQIVKRSIKFTIHLPIQNFIMILLMVAPIGLIFVSSFFISLIFTMYLFVGFSFSASIWTVYSQHIFSIATPDKFKKKKKV